MKVLISLMRWLSWRSVVSLRSISNETSRRISENKATLTYSPSFGYNLCLQRAANDAAKDYDLSTWRVAGIGGDMVRPDILRKFAELFRPNGFREEAFVPSYGLAESTLATCFAPLEAALQVDTVDKRKLAEENFAAPAGDDLPEEQKRPRVTRS